jgi:small subunit ribosomal protein S6
MTREEPHIVATNKYETVFIAEPEIPVEQVDQIIGKIKQAVESHQGSITAEDRWGRRRMAYPIQGHREGFYSVVTYSAEPTVVSALEHLFNVTDTVIRQLTIRVIKKNKTFAPRRERPAGASEGHRPPSRYGGSGRPRTDYAPRPSAPAAAAPEAAPAAPPASAATSPEGGTPK